MVRSPRLRGVARLLQVLVGLVWLAGAASLLLGGLSGVREDLGRLLTLTGVPLLAVGAAAVGLETALGVGLLVGQRAAPLASLVLLAALTGLLTARGVSEGWRVTCHCLSVVGAQSLPFAIARNVALGLVLGWTLWARRAADVATPADGSR